MRIHFRIEFDFRNGHQFTSILNYNTRSKVAFDFADKTLLMAVNIAKAFVYDTFAKEESMVVKMLSQQPHNAFLNQRLIFMRE